MAGGRRPPQRRHRRLFHGLGAGGGRRRDRAAGTLGRHSPHHRHLAARLPPRPHRQLRRPAPGAAWLGGRHRHHAEADPVPSRRQALARPARPPRRRLHRHRGRAHHRGRHPPRAGRRHLRHVAPGGQLLQRQGHGPAGRRRRGQPGQCAAPRRLPRGEELCRPRRLAGGLARPADRALRRRLPAAGPPEGAAGAGEVPARPVALARDAPLVAA